ncbi:17203_t:CDS:2 [Racocetra fulgida]|uniref:Ribosome biogenesis protein NOP53 n=1 Tax=Racocetra fulgida TaxID=60492 RepID=A0A9N9GIQ0_9GLOM|nr:17203_t:CDS:2 [Racocetra fulgida]
MQTAVLKPKTKKTINKPSRKGKKAWRKNVDITEVEEALEKIRDEERTLGCVYNNVWKNRSKIPEVFSKQRQNYGKNHTSKYTKMVLDKLAERKHLCENSNNTESSEAIMKTGEYDVWAQGSKKFYVFMDFELLMMAHEEEVVKLKQMQRINSKLPKSYPNKRAAQKDKSRTEQGKKKNGQNKGGGTKKDTKKLNERI